MKGPAMSVVFKYILWTVGIYLCYCMFMFLMQRQMIFPRYMLDSPEANPERYPGTEVVWLKTGFGKVESWYLPPEKKETSDSPSPAVIFAHGNAELIDWWPEELTAFTQLGVGVLLVEYPGYGRSDGSPSEAKIRETFLAAFDTIASRPDVDREKIILFGRSLGGGAVCSILSKRPAAALILMSAFTSIRSFAHGYLAPEFLIRDPFDNLAAVSDYTGPVLVLHGRFDEVIPYRHGVSLAGAAKNSRLLSYDCGHNDFPPGWFGFKGEVQKMLNLLETKAE